MVFSLYFCTLCCVCWQLSCKCQPDWSWMNQSPPLPLDAAAARKKERKKHKMRDRCGRKGVEHTQPAPPSTRKNPSRKRRKCCCVRRTLSRNGRTSGGPRPLVISIDPVPCRTQSPNIDKIPASQFSLLSLLSLQWQRRWLVDGETTVQKGSMSSCDEIEKKKDGPYFFFFRCCRPDVRRCLSPVYFPRRRRRQWAWNPMMRSTHRLSPSSPSSSSSLGNLLPIIDGWGLFIPLRDEPFVFFFFWKNFSFCRFSRCKRAAAAAHEFSSVTNGSLALRSLTGWMWYVRSQAFQLSKIVFRGS